MDFQPQQPVSFIPKKSLNTAGESRTSVSILWLVSVFILGVSIVGAIGAFVYGQYLQNEISVKSNSLAKSEAAYDPQSINDLITLNSRLEQANALLQKHVAPSEIFDFLQKNTLTSVRFTQFSYGENPDGTVSLKLTGNALDFASVALQSDQFDATTSTQMLSNVAFSNINIDPTSGIVSFDVNADVNPSALLYQNALADLESTSGQPPAGSSTPVAFPTSNTSTSAPIEQSGHRNN
ncbi:MAG: hypothetical protein ACREGH_03670 [Minisyncoccia bacterium]